MIVNVALTITAEITNEKSEVSEGSRQLELRY